MKALESTEGLYPCSPAKTFLKEKSITEAWNTCPYGTWMLWILARLQIGGIWTRTDEYHRAYKAYRETTMCAKPADRIRSVVTGRQVAILARKRLKYYKTTRDYHHL